MTLSACSPAEKQVLGDTITVIDHLDNEVVLPAKIERIAVCDILPLPSVIATFFDSGEKIVAMAPGSMNAAKNSLLSKLYPEILNASTGFLAGGELNTEELMKLNPDVVIYSASKPKQGEQLKNAGFNAVAVSVNKWEYNCIETLNNWISLLNQMFPENSKADTVAEYSNNVYNMIQERVKNLSDEEKAEVFFLFKYNDSAIVTAGDNFFGDWWADAIGAKNVAKELSGDNEQHVNIEQVYAWNPDTIFITNFTEAFPEDLYNNTVGAYDWSGIEAVQNKNVFKMPLGIYRSYTPGADTPITLMWLAKTAYPQLFEDIDITSETKKYYKEVFGIELTDSQAKSIFEPSQEAGSGF